MTDEPMSKEVVAGGGPGGEWWDEYPVRRGRIRVRFPVSVPLARGENRLDVKFPTVDKNVSLEDLSPASVRTVFERIDREKLGTQRSW